MTRSPASEEAYSSVTDDPSSNFFGFLKQAEQSAAEEKLQEENATLSRFEIMELKEQGRVIKAMVSHADLNVQKFQLVLNEDKTSAANKVAGSKVTYEWIKQDKE